MCKEIRSCVCRGFARDFTLQFADNRNIAVIAFETGRNDLAVRFIDMMTERLLARDKNIKVYERQRIEIIQGELDFSLSGRVSDETAQRIGRFVGADTVIYGSLGKGSGKDEYWLTISAAVTETLQLLLTKNYPVRLGPDTRLWSMGASLGTSLRAPLVIASLRGTIAPWQYTFLELGVDLGFISRMPNAANYYSIHPYAHCALFVPFNKGGWYVGTGLGYFHSEQTVSGSPERYRIITFEPTTGFIILNVLDISYTLLTNFAKASNKFSVGYVHRF
jgi:hypothetical protein